MEAYQVAYARAIERLTGADLMKMFPTPRIPTEKIPDCKPYIERGEHRLYRFSPTDYLELSAVFNGPHPETGEDLVVVDEAPEESLLMICPRSPQCSPRLRPADRGDCREVAPEGGTV